MLRVAVITLLAGVAPFVSADAWPTAGVRPATYEIAKGGLRAHVVLAGLVPMVRPLDRSVGAIPAIRVRLRGDFPAVDVAATPAYGFSTRPGRRVLLTLATSYRADGDTTTAHPVYDGALIEPDHRASVGHADIELPIGQHAALALTVTVPRRGYAQVAFRHPGDPARDLLLED
jgi:hypothetical protein